MDNTIYAGNINGNGETTECLAGFAGWSAAQAYFTNCAFLGTLNGAIGDSKTLSRNPNNITCENVYIANSFGYEDEAKATLIENFEDIATIYNCTRDAIIDASKYYDAIKDAVFYNTNEYDLIDISIGDVSVADTFEETSIKSLLES